MAQSLTSLSIHIIFSTKNRYAFFKTKTLRQQLYDDMAGICRSHNCHPVIVGGAEDHVHLLMQLHKNIALSAVIEELKKSSSKWIKTLDFESNGLRKFYWQKGYAALSVSQSQLKIVQHDIKNQEEHHKKKNFQDELREFLNRHGVCYDE
jgi:putative transposase